MPTDDVQHWLDMKRETHAQARDHADATHREFLIDGVLEGCRSILLATEALAYPGARLRFIEDLFAAVRRTAEKGETMEQLEVTVRDIWEARRG